MQFTVVIIYTFRGGCGADYSTFQNILTIIISLRFGVKFKIDNHRDAVMKNISLLITAIIFIQFISLAQSKGNIIFVDQDAQGTGNGTSWGNAFTNLVEALDSANQNDQIWVAEGVYFPGTLRTSSFQMKDDVALFGGFDGTEVSIEERDWEINQTILSGDIGIQGQASDNCYHVIKNTSPTLDSTAVLDGFTITGGNAHGSNPNDRGAGMLNISASPSVRNCIFERNSASERGGGVYNLTSSAKFSDCIVRANDAFEGGGMTNNNSSPMLLRVKFLGNYGAYGGGLCNEPWSSPIIEDCLFELNTVYDSGGAMSMHEDCHATIRRCVFRANIARYGTGGAVWHWFAGLTAHPLYVECLFELNYNNALAIFNSALRVENSVFVDNFDLDGDGGAVLVEENSAPILVNCTFSGNWADHGRAIACSEYSLSPNTVIAVNCILWDGGNEISNNYNDTIVVAYSDVYGGYPGTANINADPLFIDEYNHDFHLADSSPCINTGTAQFIWNNIQIVSLDSTSYIGSAPDMGAFEWTGGSTFVEENIVHSAEFSLAQNYPNPFNPNTRIKYSVPNSSKVIIKIFDMLGNEIETLVNEEKPVGTYEITWHAEQLPSGIYFYRLQAVPTGRQAGSFVETKKMVLLR